MIRPAEPADTSRLVALAVATGLFEPADADLLLRDVLDNIHAGRLGADHVATVCTDGPDGLPAAWAYFARDEMADGVWELFWIGVTPERHGEGIGEALLRSVESDVSARKGRLLLIATSSTPPLSRTRQFYGKRGYAECGRVPDFYADGDDKVLYVKRMARAGTPP